MSRVNISWKGNAAKRAIASGLDKGLALAAEHVLEESRRIVPHEEGTLERSGATDVDDGRASISYDTPYAVRQHEDMSLAHDAGRQAKYLETPLTQEAGVVGRIVQRELQRSLSGGIGRLL